MGSHTWTSPHRAPGTADVRDAALRWRWGKCAEVSSARGHGLSDLLPCVLPGPAPACLFLWFCRAPWARGSPVAPLCRLEAPCGGHVLLRVESHPSHLQGIWWMLRRPKEQGRAQARARGSSPVVSTLASRLLCVPGVGCPAWGCRDASGVLGDPGLSLPRPSFPCSLSPRRGTSAWWQCSPPRKRSLRKPNRACGGRGRRPGPGGKWELSLGGCVGAGQRPVHNFPFLATF